MSVEPVRTEETSVGARRATAVDLVQRGRLEESLPLWREEVASGPDGRTWVRAAAVEAMSWRDLRVAGTLAELYAVATWGSRWSAAATTDPAECLPVPPHVPRSHLSLAKLQHDIDQFRYLLARGGLDVEFEGVVEDYARIADRISPGGVESRFPLTDDDEARIGHVYNRLVHVAPAPRLDRALSSAWNPADVEERYIGGPPGLVVIDDFLAQPALESVRRFCLESTVWSGTRYPEGRLGAFFVDGFNAPLLLQIAEELRAAFPRVIGEHPLRQMWAFKNAATAVGGSNTHADFAAVNVNFWVTPTAANLDPSTGGLVVHDVTAPMSWDFTTYNERPDLITTFLRQRGARSIRIPYRENRAILFNSDLFHATEPIHFRPDYAHRRLNVTMLYGDRWQDHLHPSGLEGEIPLQGSGWRSGALTRARP